MKIKGAIDYFEPSMRVSLRAMHLQTEIMGIVNSNVNGFDKVGFQRKEPVVSSFTEYVGSHALSQAIDDQPGRLSVSENPLDLALSNKGYFQVEGEDGVKLTRDGRFHFDKDGNMLTLLNEKVLNTDGSPLILPVVPDKQTDVLIDLSGKVKVVDRARNKIVTAGLLSVVSQDGSAVLDPGVRQGFTEDSNVILNEEFMNAFPIMKTFDANRMMFQQGYSLVSTAVQSLSNM